jgi:hypothetical protein
MREGRLHKGKPEDVPKAGERHPFSRAVRSTESAMQENREREEDGSLSLSENSQEKSRRLKVPSRFFFGIASNAARFSATF